MRENTMFRSNKQGEPIRHGEVLLLRVSKAPKEGKLSKVKSFIVAHSESGHNHVLQSKETFTVREIAEAYDYLILNKPADLVHQKTHDTHDTITVEPGIYKVIKKTEYNPFTGLRESVWD